MSTESHACNVRLLKINVVDCVQWLSCGEASRQLAATAVSATQSCQALITQTFSISEVWMESKILYCCYTSIPMFRLPSLLCSPGKMNINRLLFKMEWLYRGAKIVLKVIVSACCSSVWGGWVGVMKAIARGKLSLCGTVLICLSICLPDGWSSNRGWPEGKVSELRLLPSSDG